MSNDDGVSGKEGQLRVPNIDAIAAGDVQPKRLERPFVKTFFYGFSEHGRFSRFTLLHRVWTLPFFERAVSKERGCSIFGQLQVS